MQISCQSAHLAMEGPEGAPFFEEKAASSHLQEAAQLLTVPASFPSFPSQNDKNDGNDALGCRLTLRSETTV